LRIRRIENGQAKTGINRNNGVRRALQNTVELIVRQLDFTPAIEQALLLLLDRRKILNHADQRPGLPRNLQRQKNPLHPTIPTIATQTVLQTLALVAKLQSPPHILDRGKIVRMDRGLPAHAKRRLARDAGKAAPAFIHIATLPVAVRDQNANWRMIDQRLQKLFLRAWTPILPTLRPAHRHPE